MSKAGDAGDAAGGRDGATLDSLLRQRGWLRRLAGSLVVDAAAADDLAQQALLVALEQPPAHASHPRAWLATVARRLAQRIGLADARRDARERTAAPRESLPAADEVVARAEQQHAVSAALLALPEPYRATLLLRFVDDLPPRAIAKKKGVAVETVRTQLKRGLELLRERLIAARGGGTRGAVALLGLLDDGMRRIVRRVVMKQTATASAGGGGAAGGGAASGGAAAIAAISGALWMSTKLKLAAAAVIVAGGSFALVQLAGRPQVPRSDARHEAHGREADTPAPVDAAEFALPTPVEVAAERAVVPPMREDAESTKPEAAAAVATCEIEGSVVDAAGAPVPGALVLLEDGTGGNQRFTTLQSLCLRAEELRAAALNATTPSGFWVAPLHATCDGDGRFRIAGVAATASANVAALHPDAGLGLVAGIAIDPLRPPAPIEVELLDGIVLLGEVADTKGQPVAGARLIVTAWEGEGEERRGWMLCRVEIAADGRYRSLPLPYRSLTLECFAPESEREWRELPAIPPDERTHREDFALEPQRRIEGRIVAPDGGPARLRGVERELFFCGSSVEPNDAIGDPRMLGGGELDRERDRYSCLGKDARWVSLWCDAKLLGRAEVKEEGEGPDLVVDLSLVPPPARRSPLRVEVVDGESGEPVANYDLVFRRSSHADLTGREASQRRTVVDRDGRAEVADLLLGPYDVAIRAAGYAPRFLAATVAAEPATLRVELRRATLTIAGRVIDERGRPQPGAVVDLLATDGNVALPAPDFRTRANSEGAFEFAAVAAGDYVVVALPDELAPEDAPSPAARRVAAGTRDAELVMRQAVAVHLQFRFPEGVFPMFQMRIVDERGVPLIDDLKPDVWTRRAGTERTVRLAPGAYTIEVFSPRLHGGPVRFTAADGVEVTIEMALSEPPR